MQKQRDLDEGLFLRTDSVGEMITDFVPEQNSLYHTSRTQRHQLYFMAGYPIGFLVKVFRATQEGRYLEAAKHYADFALSCGENILESPWSHNVMWGTALLARVSGETKYADFSRKLADFFVDIQDDEGCWVPHEPFYLTVAQTAEIAIWLTETDACLAHVKAAVSSTE